MSEEKIAHKICAVCGRVLNRITNVKSGEQGWGHGLGYDSSDHVVVPTDYDEALLRSICDLCGCEVELKNRHYLPVTDFDVVAIKYVSRGGYNCCPPCAEDVSHDRWNEIAKRYMEVHPSTDPLVMAALEIIWTQVAANTVGPVRPWLAGDELSSPPDGTGY